MYIPAPGETYAASDIFLNENCLGVVDAYISLFKKCDIYRWKRKFRDSLENSES